MTAQPFQPGSQPLSMSHTHPMLVSPILASVSAFMGIFGVADGPTATGVVSLIGVVLAGLGSLYYQWARVQDARMKAAAEVEDARRANEAAIREMDRLIDMMETQLRVYQAQSSGNHQPVPGVDASPNPDRKPWRQTVPRVLSDADNATLDRRLEMLRPKPLREMIEDYWQAKRKAQGDTAELPGGRVAD